MKNTRNPSKPPPTALTASPPSILSASLHSPNLPVHTPRAKAHSWKEEDTQVLVLPVQDNPTLIPASNSLTAQIQHTPSAPQQKQKHLLTHHTAPPHPGKAGQLALLPSGTRRENKWKALNRDSGAGVPHHRHHAALTTKHPMAARSPQLLLDAMHLLQKAAPSPHNPNRGQGHSWQPSSLRQTAPGPGEKELLQEALSSCRAGPPCLVLCPQP